MLLEVCMATRTGGETGPVGDLVCETRGAKRPSPMPGDKCEKRTPVPRGAPPTSLCFAMAAQQQAQVRDRCRDGEPYQLFTGSVV